MGLRSVLVFCIGVLLAHPLPAQDWTGRYARPNVLLAANVLIGGITSGVGQHLSGGSFWKGFVCGAPSGAVVYAGKRIIANEGSLNSWAGRQLAAVGSSEIRNASANRPILSELVVPLGFARLYVERSPTRIHPKLDLAATLVGVINAQRDYTSLGWKESLSHGTIIYVEPLFFSEDPGVNAAGVVRIQDIPAGLPPRDRQFARKGVIAHEIIHSAQHDFVAINVGEPIENWVLQRVRGGKTLHKYVDLGLIEPLWGGLNSLLTPHQQPWETEAHSMASGF